ncbi:hypothetical protein V5O48_008342 [Marasmius crinis-equi]|uniref:Nephrocystin 3-like N-terminal domain-containing protein n=1 Tax=Marasmius crinis-equi TaxID=585013 RepID=A0ABR3FE44_9AGAR
MNISRSSNFRVVDSNITNIRGNHNTVIHIENGDGLSSLTSKVSFHALHDSEARYPQPNVLPGTRQEIIRKLSRWSEDRSLRKIRVYWVHGAAGVGKSAIAQALSEKYILSGELAASFFFSRNDPTRDKLDTFIPTIAYQLATSRALKPLLAPLIIHTLGSMPGILHKNFEQQFRALIQEPCDQVDPRRWANLPRLVIIDGLDECVEVKSQRRLLHMIKTATRTLPLDFLIFSRPEPAISHGIHHKSFIPPPLRLDLADFAVRDDIVLFLIREFARLREEHWALLPHPKDSWPGDHAITVLTTRSTGQFVYVVTVIKFIDSGKHPATPAQRLDVVLHARRLTNSSSPYPELDQLYTQILQSCIDADQKLLQALQLIVSPVDDHLIPKAPFRLRASPRVGLRSVFAIEQLLKLAPGEATALLSGLHSVLNIPENCTDDIFVIHNSFTEFLLDPNRSSIFYVGRELSANSWTQKLIASQFRMLSQLIDPRHTPHERPLNGIHDADIGSLNVWKYYHDNHKNVPVTDELVAALNEFDPHLYLTMLLHWEYEQLYPERDSWFFEVNRRTEQVRAGTNTRDWRYNHTIAIHYQVSMFYSVFHLLKRRSSRSLLRVFIKRCTGFFRGFCLAFPRNQDHHCIQYSLLACQLSIAKLSWEFPSAKCLAYIAHLKPLLGNSDLTLEVVPLDGNGRVAFLAQPNWETRFISPIEGRLLRKLLKMLIDPQIWKEPPINAQVAEILASDKFENWTYNLARLSWAGTWRIYLFNRLIQAALRESQHMKFPAHLPIRNSLPPPE